MSGLGGHHDRLVVTAVGMPKAGGRRIESPAVSAVRGRGGRVDRAATVGCGRSLGPAAAIAHGGGGVAALRGAIAGDGRGVSVGGVATVEPTSVVVDVTEPPSSIARLPRHSGSRVQPQ
jgi:hypothetical protein